ncbi:MAG: hypothetical protein EU541_00950 [Promethearchaeota archaeon]|nr:MAG: hypothetical protein EU541_00950 [Candidatus Lokiarchaeota archaeon]
MIRTEKGKELFKEILENDLNESKAISEVKLRLIMLKKIVKGKQKGRQKYIDKKCEEKKQFPKY